MVEGEIPTELNALVPVPNQGALDILSAPNPFDAVLARDNILAGGLATMCSYDRDTEEGRGFFQRAMVSQAGEESKSPYFENPKTGKGTTFKMVAWTAAIRVQTVDKKAGTKLAQPRPFIRTVIECEDGTEIASASPYLFADLRNLARSHPEMGVKFPVECILFRGGQSDHIKDVVASQRRIANGK